MINILISCLKNLSLAKRIQTEAVCLSKRQISAGRNAVEASACSMALAITLRQHAWLHNATLLTETRSHVEDLPFEKSMLFAKLTDEFLSSVKKASQNTKTLGVYVSGAAQPHRYLQRQ